MTFTSACKVIVCKGRESNPNFNGDDGPLYLRKVLLNEHGLDMGGAYWGQGNIMWECQDQKGRSVFINEVNRHSAKQHILSNFPHATFCR